ncbi:YbaB/EbfC family nucleoid-associated protein [Nonomuraea sp. NPDC000554]|uniref:YbaB/EbfC family nucleoid-associated protein n=1 Tax=Nonomuraea sp. NPDC000554 TaxID=3154259 RepID=UPI0033211790
MYPGDPETFRLDDLNQITERAEQTQRRLTSAASEIQGINGVGESADGRIQARTDANGRLIEVTLDPRAMKMSSQDLGEEITLAVRRAWDDGEARREQLMRDAVGELPPTPDEAIERFDEILHSFNRAMNERDDRIDQIIRDIDQR